MDVYSGGCGCLFSLLHGMNARFTCSTGMASQGGRLIAMKVQVRITRTDTGSNTRIKSEPKSSEVKDAFALETAVKLETKEACKDYGSWDEALSEAERLGLISRTEAKAAKVMPPGMPYNTSTEA